MLTDAPQKLEKDYAKERDRVAGDVKRAEQESQKAGKRSNQALSQAMTQLAEKLKEVEQVGQSHLKDVIVEDRRRFCFFIDSFGQVMHHDLLFHERAVSTLKSALGDFTALAKLADTLPTDVESILKVRVEGKT